MTDAEVTESEVISPPITNNESFQRYFPSGHIRDIDYDSLPQEALEIFEGYGKRHVSPQNDKFLKLDRFFLVSHDNGDKSYATFQPRSSASTGQSEEQVCILDINADGIPTGNSVFRTVLNSESDIFKDKPSVLFTVTYSGFKNQGLGTRRLLSMNALSQMLYNLPLHSDRGNLAEYQKRIWERLVTERKARKYSQDGFERYAFVTQ